jgi:serine/threonine protein kinase
MGQVFLGYSPAGRAVAVKIIHRELARDPAFRTRFGREVAAAKVVSGAYTAPVTAAGPDDDPPWLATVFVPGPSLATAVAEAGPLPVAAVWKLAAGLVEALQAVHACGLVHRDLKPANVLLAIDGPRVIDFGISRALERTAVTSTGQIVGTPSFMAPEQAEGGQTGPATDVFSLGCVIVFAATGAGAFGDGPPASMLYRVVHAPPTLAELPGGLRELAAACLAKRPGDRLDLAGLVSLIAAGQASSPSAGPASFWPVAVTGLIRSYQGRLNTEMLDEQGGTGARPEPTKLAAEDQVPDSASQLDPAKTQASRLASHQLPDEVGELGQATLVASNLSHLPPDAAPTTAEPDLAQLSADADARMAAAVAAVSAARAAWQDAMAAHERALAKIAVTLPAPPERADLTDRLAALDGLRAAGLWTRLAAELDVIEDQAATTTAQCRAAERDAVALVDRRDELRGLLGAYRARAARLGAIEDTELEARYARARELLWTRPCDLSLAADAVTGYQQAVLALSGGGRRR